MASKRMLVVGAGASGLVSIKACKEEEFDVICYERNDDLGGLWRYTDDPDKCSVMTFTVANSSKEMGSFSDFPAPGEYPAYMPHEIMLKYLEAYARHFELRSHIVYGREVLEIVPSDDYAASGRWLVKSRDLVNDKIEEESFDGVMVCNGHQFHPSMPSYPGMNLFRGELIHSRNFKSTSGTEGKTVLVIGVGSSGLDVATEVSRVAKHVFLSTRRGFWVFPRCTHKGKQLDIRNTRRYKNLLPKKYVNYRVEKQANTRMDHKRFGIKPKHSATSQHLAINDDIVERLSSGKVTIKGDVRQFCEKGVLFADESEVTNVDTVIFATGFKVKFPFISEDIVKVKENFETQLYKGILPPQLKHHTLGIIGLLNPQGPFFPIYEMQARWFIAVMSGKVNLPPTPKMLAEVDATLRQQRNMFVQSPRHILDRPWIRYADELASMFGAKPNMAALFLKDIKLFWACYFGPCLPYQYRLNGPHKWKDAKSCILNYKARCYTFLTKK